MDNLYELGNKSRIILRPIVDMTINNHHYAANDIFLIMDNCDIRFEYKHISKTSNAEFNIQSYASHFPSEVYITLPKITTKIFDLCCTGNTDDIAYTVTETAVAEQGVIYYNYMDFQELQIYDHSGNKIITYDIDTDQHTIKSDAFIDHATYSLFYNINQSHSYNLIKNDLPYFSLEIQGCGNVNKDMHNFIFKFDAIQIDAYPILTLSSTNIMHANLKCTIINQFGHQSHLILL